MTCPKQIETEQKLNTQLADQWQSMNDTFNNRQLLEMIQVFSGHPKDGASLIPDNTNTHDAVWTFNNEKESLWIACFYQQSTVRLIHKLPNNVKKCFLNKKKNPESIFCKI